MSTPIAPSAHCLKCGRALSDGRPCAACAAQHEKNKTTGTVLMVIGALMAIGGGIPMAIGQVVPVFIACFVLFMAGLGVAAFGKKMADR